MIRSLAAKNGIQADVHPGESFVEAALAELGVDPLDRGLTVLNAHRLPSPLTLSGPTLVGALDTAVGLADFCGVLSRRLPDRTEVAVLVDLGGSDARVVRSPAGKGRSGTGRPPDLAVRGRAPGRGGRGGGGHGGACAPSVRGIAARPTTAW